MFSVGRPFVLHHWSLGGTNLNKAETKSLMLTSTLYLGIFCIELMTLCHGNTAPD
jgi:hypothetical protein